MPCPCLNNHRLELALAVLTLQAGDVQPDPSLVKRGIGAKFTGVQAQPAAGRALPERQPSATPYATGPPVAERDGPSDAMEETAALALAEGQCTVSVQLGSAWRHGADFAVDVNLTVTNEGAYGWHLLGRHEECVAGSSPWRPCRCVCLALQKRTVSPHSTGEADIGVPWELMVTCSGLLALDKSWNCTADIVATNSLRGMWMHAC